MSRVAVEVDGREGPRARRLAGRNQSGSSLTVPLAGWKITLTPFVRPTTDSSRDVSAPSGSRRDTPPVPPFTTDTVSPESKGGRGGDPKFQIRGERYWYPRSSVRRRASVVSDGGPETCPRRTWSSEKGDPGGDGS